MNDDPRQSTAYHGSWLIVSAIVLALAGVLQHHGDEGIRLPGSSIQFPESCMTHRLFRVNCPGCGLTRSTLATVRGDLTAAFRFNTAGPLIVLLIAAQLPLRGVALWRLRRGRPTFVPGGLYLLAYTSLILLVQWIVRLCG